ncbi:MAG TPA: hypothetical protein VFC79_02925 [Tissierellaceae bacterium]|nr:hypothetical protein [Tissierellaceae bacterium]
MNEYRVFEVMAKSEMVDVPYVVSIVVTNSMENAIHLYRDKYELEPCSVREIIEKESVVVDKE